VREPLVTAWGAGRIAAEVTARRVSAVEVTEAFLRRIAAAEPHLHAFLLVDADAARAAAAEIDRRLDRRLDAGAAVGDGVGPLAGVPVAVKDNLAVAGRPLTCASRILRGYVSPFDATAVARLRAAGAVIVGKTNLDEMAMGSSTETSCFAATRNPWHPDRVPGGSSGGSAAAVAAACVPLALGSDSGGSVRQPAALCGVVGLRPTWGRVSRHGLVAFASSLDQVGPLAGSVLDAALALAAVAGADRRDATSAARPVADYAAAARRGAGKLTGRRIGVLRQAEDELADAAARRVWRAGLDRLSSLGCDLVEVSVPALAAAVAAYQLLANAEASANLARFDGVRYGRRAAASPAAGGGSLDDLYRDSRSQGFGREVKRRILLGTFALSAGYREADDADAFYARARALAARLRRELAAVLDEVSWIVTPTAPGGAFRLGERLDDPLAMYLSDVFTVPASLAGLPALAVPAGFDDDGLPLSLQILGRPFDEAGVLALGHGFETARGAFPRPPVDFSPPPPEPLRAPSDSGGTG